MINKEMFHPISMDDKTWIEEIFRDEYLEICDQTFGMSYVGKYTYNIQVAEVCGCVVYRYDEGDFHSFSYPVGKNSAKAVCEIIEYIRSSGEDICISPISFSGREELLSLNIDNIMVEPLTDYFDYVYLADDLQNLRGSRYSAKRNHINKFIESNNWSQEPLSHENAAECLELVKKWKKKKEESAEVAELDEELDAEEKEIDRSLKSLDELGFFGTVIRKDNEIIAFSICELQNKDTMIVHFEKAEADIQGAYQIINKETVKNAEGMSLKYVNREDDLGIQGLRKAKKSYYPYYMGRKYSAYLSDVVFANENDLHGLKSLWKQAFNDEDKYIDEYFKYMMSENTINQRWLNESVLAVKRDGVVASMGSFLDGIIDGATVVKYVYGLATLEKFKGQGMCKNLIKYARDFFNCPLVLKPADQELRIMYKKIGFIELSIYSKLTLTDEMFVKSSKQIIDECDYTEGLMIYS